MNILRTSVLVRWFIMWILASVIIAGVAMLVTVMSGKPSTLAPSFVKGFLFALIISSPLFLLGGMLTQFIAKQKEYSSLKRIIFALALIAVLLLSIFSIGLITMDL